MSKLSKGTFVEMSNLQRKFAMYSSLTIRMEVCSYEIHICSVNKETGV